jgi:hypothetical protein
MAAGPSSTAPAMARVLSSGVGMPIAALVELQNVDSKKCCNILQNVDEK